MSHVAERALSRVLAVIGVASRLLLFAALILGPLALGLGRSARPGPSRVDRDVLPFRLATLPSGPARDRFLEPDGRSLVAPTALADTYLFCSAWAPWADTSGRTQIVGYSAGPGLSDPAIVRLSMPEGRVLDRLPLEAGWPSPATPPCWFPDRSDRVLLAGGDGTLYRLDFGRGVGRPCPLEWRGDARREIVGLTDVLWPRHSGLDRMILAVAIPARAEGPAVLAAWWLRLDQEVGAVVASGPLISRRGPAVAEERHPVLSTWGPGPARLAWLERAGEREGLRLRLGVVEFDPGGGELFVDATTARTLAEGCESAAPAFSADGRRVGWLERGPGGPAVRWADAEEPSDLASSASPGIPRGRAGAG